MGVPDGAHTHGNSGAAGLLVIVIGGALVAKYIGPVASSVGSAVSTLIDVVLWCVGGLVVFAAAAVSVMLVRGRVASRATAEMLRVRAEADERRHAQRPAISGQRVVDERELPSMPAPAALPAAEGPAVHHHWHLQGVTAEELAAALDAYRARDTRPDMPDAREDA